jgi:hypothetical protein
MGDEAPLPGLAGVEDLGMCIADNDMEGLIAAMESRCLSEEALQSLFELAARLRGVEAARLLVRRGASPGVSSLGSRILGDAASKGDAAAFEELLSAGADINGEVSPGISLLESLCRTPAAVESLSLALERRELRLPAERHPADWAIEEGNWAAVEAIEKAHVR